MTFYAVANGRSIGIFLNWNDCNNSVKGYKNALYKESKKRKVDTDIAWDKVKWIDLEMKEDFLEKAKALFNGEECDTRVQFPVDLDDDTILKLSMEAHKRDITLNKMIEIILQEVIDRHRVNGTLA